MQNIRIGKFNIIFSIFNDQYIEIENENKKISVYYDNNQFFVNNILMEQILIEPVVQSETQIEKPQEEVKYDAWTTNPFADDPWKIVKPNENFEIESKKTPVKRRTSKTVTKKNI